MTAEAAPSASVVVVVGGDAVVGDALTLLLCGSGYGARYEGLPAFDAERALRQAAVVLLAPGLPKLERDAVLSSVRAACRIGDLPVLELVPATTAEPREGHALVSWPCRTEDLEREIEATLTRGKNCVGPMPDGNPTAHNQGQRSRR